jgi:[NiFe] hydrogenase large subunit
MSISIITSTSNISVPEGGTATFHVKLGSNPGSTVSVVVARSSGDSDITVSDGAELKFRKNNWSEWQTVTLSAAQDGDSTDGSAVITCSGDKLTSTDVTVTEVDDDATAQGYEIVLDQTSLTVPEGGTASFGAKLSADPGKAVTVTTGYDSGDADITVASGGTLSFDSTDWSTAKSVTLFAAEDGDTTNGETIFAVSSAEAVTQYLTAAESDTTTSGNTVVIDPVSRIEGHLRIEVEVTDGFVSKAWSSATLFRGIEPILLGRDPLDAPIITQRLCGVCTYVHAATAISAIEDAADVTAPENARIVRNLLMGAQFLHDHIVHFYNLHGLDWVDVVSALSADPASTESLAASLSPNARPLDFAGSQSRLQKMVDTGNLGPFANAYWGHTAYSLTPEENLLLVTHYLEALRQQIETARMMSILGGKNPHPQSMVVGGVTCGNSLTTSRLNDFRAYLDTTKDFVDTIYMPDLEYLAGKYSSWASIGGFFNHMAYGEFPLGANIPSDLFMPRGYIMNGDLNAVYNLDEAAITEHVARSWYQGSTDQHPATGVTDPNWTDLNTSERYSWSKAPRYNGEAMEVGPLSRVLVGYASGKAEFVNAVNNFLQATGLTESQLFSTLGRTAARAIESQLIGNEMHGWVNQLETNMNGGNTDVFVSSSRPSSAWGVGWGEAPRGALGHWIEIGDGNIANYQMVVPSTWNFGPRCAAGIPSPLEKALVGTPVSDTANPVEILRVVHSYDPCIACGVHVVDAKEGTGTYVRVL